MKQILGTLWHENAGSLAGGTPFPIATTLSGSTPALHVTNARDPSSRMMTLSALWNAHFIIFFITCHEEYKKSSYPPPLRCNNIFVPDIFDKSKNGRTSFREE